MPVRANALLRVGAPVIVVKNAFWLSFCRIAADLSSLAVFTVISRHFGPVGTGEYSYAFALGAFIAIFATSGLEQYGVRQYARLISREEQAACWRILLLTQCLQLTGGIVLLGIVLVAVGAQYAEPIVTLELSIFLIGWGLSRTLYIPAIAAQAMVGPAFTELGCRLAGSLGALLLSWLGVTSLPCLLAGFPLAAIVLVALSMRNATHHGAALSLKGSWRGVATVARGAASFTVCEALGQFYMRTDLLLIVLLLGKASGGWYATDIKIVEVGIMPLLLLGTAAYPVLSRSAAHDRLRFAALSQDFLRSVMFASGWLAVAMFCLVPLLITELFGEQFRPAGRLLPWFALLAIAKGMEVVLYRLLYAVRRQNTYMGGLAIGTVLIVLLNFSFIPAFGTGGAICVVVLSSTIVNSICIIALRDEVSRAVFGLTLARLAGVLALTALAVIGLRSLGASDWYIAIGACALFPLLGVASGLVPHPQRSPLFA